MTYKFWRSCIKATYMPDFFVATNCILVSRTTTAPHTIFIAPIVIILGYCFASRLACLGVCVCPFTSFKRNDFYLFNIKLFWTYRLFKVVFSLCSCKAQVSRLKRILWAVCSHWVFLRGHVDIGFEFILERGLKKVCINLRNLRFFKRVWRAIIIILEFR